MEDKMEKKDVKLVEKVEDKSKEVKESKPKVKKSKSSTSKTNSKKVSSKTSSNKSKTKPLQDRIKNKEYEVKHYIPYAEQRYIANTTVAFAVVEREDGFIEVDYGIKEMIKILFLVDAITDLDILGYIYMAGDNSDGDNDVDIEFNPDRAYEIFDLVCEYGLDKDIYDATADKVYSRVDYLVDNDIKQQMEIQNSLSMTLGRKINELIGKIPDEASMNGILDKIPQMIGSLDKEKLGLIGKALGSK